VLLRIGHLTAVMVILTTYGIPVLLVVTVAQWWIGHDRQSVRHVCVAAFMAFVVSLSFNQFLLLSIHRVRSYDSGTTHLLIPPIADWSFPYGRSRTFMWAPIT
jgi:hypothetical protein